MLPLSLKVVWLVFAFFGMSHHSDCHHRFDTHNPFPSQRHPGYVVRLHPVCFRHSDVLGPDPILHHGHRP